MVVFFLLFVMDRTLFFFKTKEGLFSLFYGEEIAGRSFISLLTVFLHSSLSLSFLNM